MTALTPQYMRVLADDVQHTVDNGYEFAPENVTAALRTAADQLEAVTEWASRICDGDSQPGDEADAGYRGAADDVLALMRNRADR